MVYRNSNAVEQSAGGGELTAREVIEMKKMRGAITRRVTAGHAVPNTTLVMNADFSAAVALQRSLVDEWRPLRLRPQYQDLVIAALVAAIKEHPRANSHLVDDKVYVFDEINVAIAVAVGAGLVAPTIKNAQDKSLLEIARAVRAIVRSAKQGKMSPENVTRSTITVSSLAGYDIESFTPIINAPETNVLGVGKIEQQPRFVDGELQNRWIGYLSLTFDHRAWDGAPAARFLNSIAAKLKAPEWMRAA